MKCPKCGSEMVLRTARKGAHAGKKFWGCSNYPYCNGTISYGRNRSTVANRKASAATKTKNTIPPHHIDWWNSSNPEVLKALYKLRNRIKEEGIKTDGKTLRVCDDKALEAMAELLPKTVQDLESVPNVGKKFIDSYGSQFLEVINEYTQTDSEKATRINKKLEKTLKAMSNQLVSINRRNRLLYMPKIANKYGVDIYNEKVNPVDGIFGKGKRLVVKNEDSSDLNKNSKYKKTVQLLREIDKDLRDKGHNDFYIGYPYVIGRLPGENFDVRCPLALFPVRAEKEPGVIRICADDERDIIYNNTFILSFLKFNNIQCDLPEEVVDDDFLTSSQFVSTLLQHYKENGINIVVRGGGLVPFCDYKKDEFPHFNQGELYLEENVVLGKFPVRDSSIHRDFDKIIDEGEINTLLDELLTDVEDREYEDDSISGIYETDEIDGKIDIPEENLIYINDLNSSQENVLNSIEKLDGLVVQGPPGTGKSQTITSLIADFACKGRTVLMVSEKKTALDVVYSRLGDLSKYALLIDDTGNKNLFYKQLETMINLGHETQGKMDLSYNASDIDELIFELERIADELFSLDERFKVEPYKVYRESKSIKYEKTSDIEIIKNCIDEDVLSFDYNELNESKKVFERQSIVSRVCRYTDIVNNYPKIEFFKNNISSMQLQDCKDQFSEISSEIDNWKNKNFIARLFSKGKVMADITALTDKYISEESRIPSKQYLISMNLYTDALNYYEEYQKLRTAMQALTKNQMIYFKQLKGLADKIGVSIKEANHIIYNYILCKYIDEFENRNREVLNYIDSFEDIMGELDDLINEKKMFVRRALEKMLQNDMYNMSISKRKNDILRRIESTRKWSVNKFINKYQFELFNSVRIWLLTPEVVSELIPLRRGIFDLLIFDEASQMYVEKGVPAIYRAKKVVIAGDQKQLRPSNLFSGRVEYDLDAVGEDEEITAALEEESLLDLARYRYRDVLLNFHYRSKYEELIAFSNHAFYKGRLYVAPNNEIPARPPIEVHKLANGMWANRSNLAEAQEVVKLLKNFFEERKEAETIGIITFNITQRDLIDDLIDEEMTLDKTFAARIKNELSRKENGEDIGLFIKNIENVQGDERDVIIFSIGYARNSDGRIVRNFGWLNQKGGENRLNVAISRARKKIHIVTSIYPSELQTEDIKNEGPKLLKKYLEYSFNVSNNDKYSAQQVLYSFGDEKNPGRTIQFDSPFEEEVFYALVDAGLEVDTQVGIGGYSIDLAIKYRGSYILGIECDGKLYHSSRAARERDYHRQKYLESRGWTIHRIWSTNWWKNKRHEIEKICDLVEALKEKFDSSYSVVQPNDANRNMNLKAGEPREKRTYTKKKTDDAPIKKQIKVEPSGSSTSRQKRCEECKYYVNESCAGLKLCEDYLPIPLS